MFLRNKEQRRHFAPMILLVVRMWCCDIMLLPQNGTEANCLTGKESVKRNPSPYPTISTPAAPRYSDVDPQTLQCIDATDLRIHQCYQVHFVDPSSNSFRVNTILTERRKPTNMQRDTPYAGVSLSGVD